MLDRRQDAAAAAAGHAAPSLEASVLALLPHAVYRVDRDGRLVWANEAMLAMLGGGPLERWLGITAADVYPPELAARYREDDLAVMASGQPLLHVEEHVAADGRRLLVDVVKVPVPGPDGAVTGVQGTFIDATRRELAARDADYLAHHDGLTGLPNRWLLRDRLGRALSLAARHGGRVAVMFIDLDRFKQVNDLHGHAVGDRLLVQAGERLVGALRASDTVARQGGDEFIALLPDVRSPEDAAIAAEAVLRALAAPFEIDGLRLHVSGSVGVAMAPDDGIDPDALLRSADLAMYEAKAAGRNAARFFRPGLEDDVRRLARVEAELREALEGGQFLLEIQPEIDLASGGVSALEALVRWQHPARGLLLPGEFIRVCEESGLVVPLGREVIRQACRVRARLRGLLPDDVPLAVNISAMHLLEPAFLAWFCGELEASGLPGRALEIEITEHTLVRDAAIAARVLDQLRLLGVRVAIDDFGTGYSSLAILHQLPVGKLKIDRSFVEAAGRDDEAGRASVAGAIAGLARSMGLSVVAEGVERVQQDDAMRRIGCTAAQGWLYAPPMAPDALVHWLERRAAA